MIANDVIAPIQKVGALSSHLWIQIGTEMTEFGPVQLFIPNKAISHLSLQEKRVLGFPAIELSIEDLFHFVSVETQLIRNDIVHESSLKLLREMGYKLEGDILHLPDVETLINAWGALGKSDRAPYKPLPPLRICVSEGLASNEEFLKSWYENDINISKDKAFVHDQLYHAASTLLFMMNPDYTAIKMKLVRGIQSLVKRIETAKDQAARLVNSLNKKLDVFKERELQSPKRDDLISSIVWIEGTKKDVLEWQKKLEIASFLPAIFIDSFSTVASSKLLNGIPEHLEEGTLDLICGFSSGVLYKYLHSHFPEETGFSVSDIQKAIEQQIALPEDFENW